MKFKDNIHKDQMVLSNLIVSWKKAQYSQEYKKKSIIQQGQTHNVYHLIKNYPAPQKQNNLPIAKRKKKIYQIILGMTQIIVDKDIEYIVTENIQK